VNLEIRNIPKKYPTEKSSEEQTKKTTGEKWRKKTQRMRHLNG